MDPDLSNAEEQQQTEVAGVTGRALLVATMGAMIVIGASDPRRRARRVHGVWLNQRP